MPQNTAKKKPRPQQRSKKNSPKKTSNHLFFPQFIAIIGILIIVIGSLFLWYQRTQLAHDVSNDPPIPIIPIQPDGGGPEPSVPNPQIPIPQTQPEPVPQPQPQPQITADPPKLSLPVQQTSIPIVIVIDDVGYDISLLERFMEIPVPITYAILPGVPHTTESALLLGLYNQEIILHLPMENVLGLDPGPGTLWDYMSDQEIREQLLDNIQQVPGLVGMNNHMGSKGTQDRRIMNIVLDLVKEFGLFFLDSRTTAQSVVAELSKAKNLPFLERHVFLDNESNREAILQALQTGLNQASNRGYAVMIGHVWTQELADIILELYPYILEQGFHFVSLADLLQLHSQE